MKATKLTAMLLVLFATVVSAQNTYVITGSGESFAATGGSLGGSATGTIQEVITSIQTDANGENCGIQFGDGTTVLDIGSANITFNGIGWGKITLSGKITSSSVTNAKGTIFLDNEASITSTAHIANTASSNNGNAIYNASTGAVNISGGEVSATTGQAIYNTSTGAVNISGGEVSATTGQAIRNASTGKITVSNNAKITSAITNSNYATIYLESTTATGELLAITGGTVENTSTTGYAVRNTKGTVNISGGEVLANEGCAVFNNSSGTINISGGTVSITGNSGYAVNNYSTGAVNISGGEVSATGSGYAVNNNSSGTIKVSGGTVSANDNVAIYIAGAPNSTYKGGSITISGTAQITSANTSYRGTVYMLRGGNSDIEDGTLRMSGGSVSNTAATGNAIVSYSNAGNAVDISGGEVSTKNGVAVYNGYSSNSSWSYSSSSSAGLINISGTARITSANTYQDSGTIFIVSGCYNKRLSVTGGSIENTAVGGNAVRNNSAGAVNISGGEISATTGGSAVWNNSTGPVNISGGEVKATTGNAVRNNSTGKITVSGTAQITSTGTNQGTIHLVTGTAGTEILAITDGTVENTNASGKAVHNSSVGVVNLSGIPAITGRLWSANGNTLGVVTSSSSSSAFAPGTKTYTLDFDSYTEGIIAVKNGGNFRSNFKLNETGWMLAASGGNLVVQEGNDPGESSSSSSEPSSSSNAPSSSSSEPSSNSNVPSSSSSEPSSNSNAPSSSSSEPSSSSNAPSSSSITPSSSSNGSNPIQPQIANGNIQVQAKGNAIVLENLPANAKVEIYNLQGKRIYSAHPENLQILRIGVQTKGIYIIKISLNSETKLLKKLLVAAPA